MVAIVAGAHLWTRRTLELGDALEAEDDGGDRGRP
jgi:hypothetical protein